MSITRMAVLLLGVVAGCAVLYVCCAVALALYRRNQLRGNGFPRGGESDERDSR